MHIDGYLYQQNNANRQPAKLFVDSAYYTLYLDKKKLIKASTDSLDIPSRIGNTSRKFQIDTIGLFETMDNDAIDKLFINGRNRKNWIHALESQWRIAVPAIVIGIAFSIGLFVWGVPYAAEKVAYAIPERVNEKISAGTFDTIDKLMLSPSELPQEQQDLIAQQFSQLVADYGNSKFHYRLHFRDMAGEPNAFALPDGNIVVTDQLIKYAGNETNEVLAVLLHEIGHVEHRHGLRMALEASSVAVLIAMLTGDVASSDDLLVTLPTILSTSAFSRQHEEEADEYALQYMQKAQLDPIHFARIMSKITHTDVPNKTLDKRKEQSKAEDGITDAKDTKESPSRVEKAVSYLSSHPITKERIQKAEAASLVFIESNKITN